MAESPGAAPKSSRPAASGGAVDARDRIHIRRALVSVYDKTGIVDFCRALHGEFGIEIISTGGTARTLREAGIPVTLVEELTGFPELLDGRVKTLHPAIHAAILADRDNPEHMRQLEAAGIKPIDMVVVTLYPFEKTVADPDCTFEQAIEMIDIGGVALLRAAAKNHRHVLVPTFRQDLEAILLWMREDALTAEGWERIRKDYAASALATTNRYDGEISRWLSGGAREFLSLNVISEPRYGENPQQRSAISQSDGDANARRGLPWADFLRRWWAGPEMSYNNYLDADAALGLCAELTRAGSDCNRRNVNRIVSPAPLARSDTESGAPRKVWNRPMAGFPSAPLEVSPSSNTAPAPKSTPPSPGFAASRKPITDETFSRRNLPHIQRPGASYFITFRAARDQGNFTPPERDIVMDCCLYSDGELFCLHAAVCMPDHVHLLLTPLEASPGHWRSLTEVMHSIKGNIGRLVAENRKRPGTVLQDESFDHIVRNEQDLLESLEYIRTNPARAGLESSNPYPWIVLETAPGWDASTRAAGIDLKHELWAPRVGQRAWYSRMAPGVPETPGRPGHSIDSSTAGGAELNRPLAGSTLSERNQPLAGSTLSERKGPLAGSTPSDQDLQNTQSNDAPANRSELESGDKSKAEHCSTAGGAACVFIKHTNACGVGVQSDPVEAYRAAYLGDPNAAMGGIVAVNFTVDAAFAALAMETYDRFGKPLKEAGVPYAPGGFFVEVWIAPRFTDDAVAIIRGAYDPANARPEEGEARVETAPKKKWGEKVRLLAVGDMSAEPDPSERVYRSIAGGMLVQTPDLLGLNEDEWKVVTKRAPTEAEIPDLRLAWLICKHTKSNAISIVRDGMLIGNGAGQMSRVMSCRVATWLARENGHLMDASEQRVGVGELEAGNPTPEARNSPVAASDAFFPFRDGPDILIEAGVTAIIQPGGGKRDAEVIAACDERGVAMVFTGTRHFRH